MTQTTIDSKLDAEGWRFAIVVSRYNDFLTNQLLDAVTKTLSAAGASPDNILVVKVPGSDETPLAAEKLARCAQADAIIALGVVIEGETAHADIITHNCSHSLARIASTYDLPVINGVISARSMAQAVARAEKRGQHFAEAAIHMLQTYSAIQKRTPIIDT
ncbi:MAG: 6,7-dimethyl-8-ribityllumazine synthase [Candidatus Promineifilaceae bacterium]|jgi:6,7-dimethyl-8-ribityllumazine synthase